MTDLYTALGLPRDATRAQIRAAYRTLAKTKHPDAGGSEEEFERIKLAHDVLTDDKRRKLYDETGQTKQAPDPRSFILQEIASALDQIAQHEQFSLAFDIAEAVRQVLARRLGEHQQATRKAEQALARSQALVGRFSRRKGKKKAPEGENIFEQLIRGRITTLERTIVHCKAQAEIAEQALELVQDYEFRADQAPMMRVYYTSFGLGGMGGGFTNTGRR